MLNKSQNLFFVANAEISVALALFISIIFILRLIISL